MDRIAKFEKVSFDQFKKSVKNLYSDVLEESVRAWWEAIKLPARATKGSAGYDFYAPFSVITEHREDEIIIPTGIRCKMENGWALVCMPKSGLGFKYGVRLKNTLGLIDAKER